MAEVAGNNHSPQERVMHHTRADFEWNDDTIGRLRVLWAEGHRTAEIGRRIGVSKNAVVGKSHRLNLAARPSPIRKGGPGQTTRPRRLRCPSLAELQGSPQQTSIMRLAPAATGTASAPVTAKPIRTPHLGNQSCCWPIGEPGTRGFRFCDVTNEAGKPYCPEHCSIAYQKVRNRQVAA